MRLIVSSLALAFVLLPVQGTREPAAASPHGSAGIDFAVGGVGFSLGFHDVGHRHDGAGYYYRTRERLSYSGHQCSSACILRDDVYYHHPECPVVLRHFDVHGFDPYPVWTALPDGGVSYYPYAHGPEFHDDHHGRRHGRGHGGHFDRRHGDSNSDSDSDSDSTSTSTRTQTTTEASADATTVAAGTVAGRRTPLRNRSSPAL